MLACAENPGAMPRPADPTPKTRKNYEIPDDIIAELEPYRRSFYAGCVGYVAYSGNMDMALALRTMAVRNGTVYMQAGGGIVYDSTADFEYQETLNKMGAAMRALELAEQLELEAREQGTGNRACPEPVEGEQEIVGRAAGVSSNGAHREREVAS